MGEAVPLLPATTPHTDASGAGTRPSLVHPNGWGGKPPDSALPVLLTPQGPPAPETTWVAFVPLSWTPGHPHSPPDGGVLAGTGLTSHADPRTPSPPLSTLAFHEGSGLRSLSIHGL